MQAVLASDLLAMAEAVRAGSVADLSALDERVTLLARDLTDAPEWGSVVDALGEAVLAARSSLGERGLAGRSGSIEAGSLPARMLREIGRGARVGNADLAHLLKTDASQLSRAGRRLRDAGLATRTRSGRINVWDVTADGQAELSRLRRMSSERAGNDGGHENPRAEVTKLRGSRAPEPVVVAASQIANPVAGSMGPRRALSMVAASDVRS